MTRVSCVLCLAVFLGSVCAQEETPPNVVIIYGDDVGYGDVGAYGAELIPTPNIDRLAREGLVFTDGHCSAATCTPSRYSLLTGVHGFRSGVRVLPPNAPLVIDTSAFTLPRVFKKKGYRTGIIGKWHLGLGARGSKVDWNDVVAPGPIELGFDECFLLPSTNDRVPCVYLDNHRVPGLDPADPLFIGKAPAGFSGTVYPDGKTNPEAMTYYGSTQGHNNSIINGIGRIGYMHGGRSALWNDETMTDVFVERTRDFLKNQKKDQPFFLMYSSQDIHVPRTPHPRFKGMTPLSYRGDAMVAFDWAVGQVMEALRKNGFADNTMVILSSDNGPVYDDGYEDGTTVFTSRKEVDRGHDGSGVYRGGKYQIYEGGTRVPFIVHWPDRIQAQHSSALVSQIDFVASFASFLGVEIPDGQAIDSQDVHGALLGQATVGNRRILEEARRLALRDGHWKFIPKGRRQKTPELYNLQKDPSEQKNLATEYPERALEMSTFLKAVRQAEGGLRSLN